MSDKRDFWKLTPEEMAAIRREMGEASPFQKVLLQHAKEVQMEQEMRDREFLAAHRIKWGSPP